MSSRRVFILSVFHLTVAFAMSQCMHQSKDLELSIFEDPQYGDLNIDNLDDAFFPTNDRESLSVDIQYEFNGYPHNNITFRWAWSPVNLFIYPFDFQFLSLFTVRYPTGSCTVQIAMPFCSNVSEDEIVELLHGFTQAVRGNIVDGYSSSDGRKIDNHQTGYTSVLDYDTNPDILFALLLTGAFLSTAIPFLLAFYRCLLKSKSPDCTCNRCRGYYPVQRNPEEEKEEETSPGEKDTPSLQQENQEAQSTLRGRESAEVDDEEKKAWTYGCTVVLRLLALVIAVLEMVHFWYGVRSHHKDIGRPQTFFAALGIFGVVLLVDISSSCLIIKRSNQCKGNKAIRLLDMMLIILGVQLLLFHAPFIFLGLSSLPFQASITIAMYGSVIIVIVTGISLSRYEYLIRSKKRSCSECVIIATTILTATVITLLAAVDIEITRYFHSTSDISQTAPTQFFTSLLSLAASTAFSFLLWKKYLQMCHMLKGWLDKNLTSASARVDENLTSARALGDDSSIQPENSTITHLTA